MNELVITTEEGTFIFVTRDGTEPFTLEEAKEHLGTRVIPGETTVPEDDFTCGWHIPNDKMCRHIFLKDLRNGIQFCVEKYGQPKEAIEAEAKRLGTGGF
jgi:hypothetical protein